MKNLLFISLLIIVASLVSSETVLEFTEGDLIDLRPVARDDDNDTLSYFFEPPLTNKGQWQTTYGDQGTYDTKVTVSDGKLLASEGITLIVNKKEESPELEIVSPQKETLYIVEGKSIFFNVRATDLNKDPLTITWLVDLEEVAEGTSFTYTASYYSEGRRIITARVSDGVNVVENDWLLEVDDFDRTQLLDTFAPVLINETHTIMFDIPDFDDYLLFYNISGPVGDDGIWETTYDDAGVYDMFITIWDGKDFQAEKKIKLGIEDVDRHAIPSEITNYWLAEDQVLEIPLDYMDPDGDEVTVDVENLPEGAVFENGTIKWQPNFDVVTKKTFFDSVASQYHVLSRQFTFEARASSQELVLIQPFTVRVFNTNRQPILEEIPEVIVNEGERINFNLAAADPDEDDVSFSFDGIINRNNYKTKIGQAGTYIVPVTVSDGFLTHTQFTKVVINPVNMQPSLERIAPIRTKEGSPIKISLKAKDPDDDELTYSVEPFPEGAYFKGTDFYWTPDFDTVQETSTLTFLFTVSDENMSASKEARVTVSNVNRPPKLIASTQIDGRTFYLDEQIDFEVSVEDPDGDDLSYIWKTSLFESFEDDADITMEFIKTGKKTISVTASDGSESISKEWTVFIEKRPSSALKFASVR
ncbi:hypothetical protein GOV09_04910 [Candidatus Woesearchaeota archaeon]|nr:hypothetical protein [Candidatus Woesearchaeota archaeon]